MGIIVSGNPPQVNKCILKRWESSCSNVKNLRKWRTLNFLLIPVQERNAFVCVMDSFDFCGQNVKTIVHGLFLFFVFFPPQTANYSHLDKLWTLKRAVSEPCALPFPCGVQGQIELNYNLFFIVFFFLFFLAIRPCCSCGSPLSSKCSGNMTLSPKDFFYFKSRWTFMQWRRRCLHLRCSTPFPQSFS